jgi:ribonuclease P protein component
VKYYDEANLAAEGKKAGEDAWLPKPHVHAGRPQCAQDSATERSLPVDRVTADQELALAVGFAMKRKFRLTKGEDFARVRLEGRYHSNPLLALGASPNALTHSRFGFVVSRRIGKAVRRNRVKRLLREAIRLRLGQIAPGFDVVVITRTAAAEADFWTLDTALARLLEQAGLLMSVASSGEIENGTGQASGV